MTCMHLQVRRAWLQHGQQQVVNKKRSQSSAVAAVTYHAAKQIMVVPKLRFLTERSQDMRMHARSGADSLGRSAGWAKTLTCKTEYKLRGTLTRSPLPTSSPSDLLEVACTDR